MVGLNVAVIGLGRMGVRHLQAVKNLGMNICGVADISSAALDSVKKDFDVDSSACFFDAEKMLRDIRPEALVIATTAPSHATLVCIAAEVGVRYILCEKPMATSLAEVDLMLDVCKRSGSVLAINHQMRFMHYAQIKTMINSEELGPLVSILVAGSNFGLAMNASHYFEMFHYITDTSVTRINAWFDDEQLPNPRGSEFKDCSGRLLARNDTGLSMYIDFAGAAGHGLQVTYICRFGQIVIDELTGDVRVTARQEEFRSLPSARYGMPADIQNIVIESKDIVTPTMDVWSAMLEGRSFPDGKTGAHVINCLVAAHASHNSGGSEVLVNNLNVPRDIKYPWA